MFLFASTIANNQLKDDENQTTLEAAKIIVPSLKIKAFTRQTYE